MATKNLGGKTVIVTFSVAITSLPAFIQNQSWADYGGGADSTHYVRGKQITKANVEQLDVAWVYPHGETGFPPIIAGKVMYALGSNGSFIALDATTGKEIWVHAGLRGITSSGINYWERQDHKDRRLIFSINSYLQEIDAVPGQSAAGSALLPKALAIYENTLGPNSDQARFVRGRLVRPGH